MDYDDGQRDFHIKVCYHHSDQQQKYTDFLHLSLMNDVRDDDNLALDKIDISTRQGAADAIVKLDEALFKLAKTQSKLGAVENRFAHNLDQLSMNLLIAQKAKGRIIDADIARESVQLARLGVLNQAMGNVLATSNQSKRAVLDLIEAL